MAEKESWQDAKILCKECNARSGHIRESMWIRKKAPNTVTEQRRRDLLFSDHKVNKNYVIESKEGSQGYWH